MVTNASVTPEVGVLAEAGHEEQLVAGPVEVEVVAVVEVPVRCVDGVDRLRELVGQVLVQPAQRHLSLSPWVPRRTDRRAPGVSTSLWRSGWRAAVRHPLSGLASDGGVARSLARAVLGDRLLELLEGGRLGRVGRARDSCRHPRAHRGAVEGGCDGALRTRQVPGRPPRSGRRGPRRRHGRAGRRRRAGLRRVSRCGRSRRSGPGGRPPRGRTCAPRATPHQPAAPSSRTAARGDGSPSPSAGPP